MTITNARRGARNCLDCGRALRPMKADKSEWPGTIIHQGRGLCSTHYHARLGAGTLKDLALLQQPRSETPFESATDPDEQTRIERLRRDQVLFHRGWRRRNGLDVTAPIDLREIVMA